ncbi:sensor histidine kinase [Alishewanella longhuensis]
MPSKSSNPQQRAPSGPLLKTLLRHWRKRSVLFWQAPIPRVWLSLAILGLLLSLMILLTVNWFWPSAATANATPVLLALSMLWVLHLLIGLLLTWQLRPLQREIAALNLHAQNLQDGSFNTSANQQQIKVLAPLAAQLQQMTAELRLQRSSLYQRELLLDTLVQANPGALILTNAAGRVLMTNPSARQLLNHGKDFNGSDLQLYTQALPELAEAIQHNQAGLVRLAGKQAAVWHLAISQFQLHNQQHHLYLLKPLSRELAREELNAWKTLLRVISHELNNTLAPLSSLAYSGQVLAGRQQQAELSAIFNTISERCQALNQFLQDYIRFAKLPAPTLGPVNWPQLINQLQDQYEFELVGELPKRIWHADQSQLSQLLLNLLKNAHETGCSPEQITLSFSESPKLLQLYLQDRAAALPPILCSKHYCLFTPPKPRAPA